MDHVLRGLSTTASYMYRVTEGTCIGDLFSDKPTYQGILLTGVTMPTVTTSQTWYLYDITLDC